MSGVLEQPLVIPPAPRMALPLHIQHLERVLNLSSYIRQLENILKEDHGCPRFELESPKATKETRFNFANVTPERQWIKDLLLSETDDSDTELSESEKIRIMLELQYKQKQRSRNRLKRLSKVKQYQYLSAGLLLPNDKYPEVKKKFEQEKKKFGRSTAKKSRDELYNDYKKDEKVFEDDFSLPFERQPDQDPEEYRSKLWNYIAKKEIPKMAKVFSQARHITMSNNKKVAVYCQREVRRWATKSQKLSKESNSVQPRARKVIKEVLAYWRKYEKVEKEARKKAEKEAQEQQKLYDEMREARRQQRKLNFLITQTELYAHFMSKKFTGEEKSAEDILRNLEDKPLSESNTNLPQSVLTRIIENDEYDSEVVKAQALTNVQNAVEKQKAKHSSFVEAVNIDGTSAIDLQQSFDKNFSLANPSLTSDHELSQPTMFNGQLKAYQLKGMNWLASLYDQGINGILADEMGLGKTVQSIALLAHLAEHQNIWGPFLIVSPASTLHNWQQECTRFVGSFKVLPYWGNPHERKVIRKYWNQKLLCHKNAPFHVLITSYQLVVQDFKYFQRLKWQYMILDEAQAIKSSSSVRWKLLMSFNCRNRLLLTGTPIQNTMAELWALLHFIMPTMFDSHEEFSEWFSKDIENHAEKKSALDENQLSRLHMILKPFMLRRIKKDVEHEMAEKIEIHLSCGLSSRQRELYHRLKERISIDDLLHSSLSSSSSHPSKDSTSTLMNIVMQFRKVCNHPDLFERRDVLSPIDVSLPISSLPRLLYNSCLLPLSSRHRLLTVQMGVSSPHHAHQSSIEGGRGLWDFSRLCNLSPGEGFTLCTGSLVQRFECLLELVRCFQIIYLWRFWDSNLIGQSKRYQLLIPSSVDQSLFHNVSLLSGLVFTGHTSSFYTHSTHLISPLCEPESNELKEISSTVTNVVSTTVTEDSVAMETGSNEYRCCQPTSMPSFLIGVVKPKVHATCPQYYINDSHAEYCRQNVSQGGPPDVKSLFKHGRTPPTSDAWLRPPPVGGLDSSHPINGWSHIDIPDKERIITDSHKMVVLDRLLAKLKREGHRVLVYSQMTKMIDLLEEFMSYRRHKYIRLDGSSRISERRDMVDDFQTKSDIFVFLLSTRAGGLGINLTAADTVIFYDSDWNPTVDQQAMDRAHRLGQTKQVTVYRLIVKGSIEERILQRAREKSEIQKMVISGGDFKIDTLKPKEVVSLLLDDEEMETRFLTKQAEKKMQEELSKQKNTTRKRKNAQKQSEGGGGSTAKRTHLGTAHSISPSPSLSRPGSVNSLANSETLNGDYIDVVGGFDQEPVPRPLVNNDTPTRGVLGKRGRRGNGSKGNGIKRSKATTSGRSLLVSKSPSNSIPSSPRTLKSNGTGSSPKISPAHSSQATVQQHFIS